MAAWAPCPSVSCSSAAGGVGGGGGGVVGGGNGASSTTCGSSWCGSSSTPFCVAVSVGVVIFEATELDNELDVHLLPCPVWTGDSSRYFSLPVLAIR